MGPRRRLVFALGIVSCGLAARGEDRPERFSVAVRGRRLMKNDGSGTRFFVSGMVYGSVWGSSYDLERYRPADVETIIRTISGYGGSALAWRTFLKGLNERGKLDWSRAFLDGTFAPAKKGAKQ